MSLAHVAGVFLSGLLFLTLGTLCMFVKPKDRPLESLWLYLLVVAVSMVLFASCHPTHPITPPPTPTPVETCNTIDCIPHCEESGVVALGVTCTPTKGVTWTPTPVPTAAASLTPTARPTTTATAVPAIRTATSVPTPSLSPSPAPTPRPRVHRLLLLPVEWDNWRNPTNRETYQGAADYQSAFLNNEYGVSDFTVDLYWPPMNLGAVANTCDSGGMSFLQGAVQRAQDEGHVFDQSITFGPKAPLCGFRSNANYIIAQPSYAPPLGETVAHEHAHLRGLAHTSTIGRAQPFDPEAAFAKPWTEQNEYGNSDWLGGGRAPGTSYHRQQTKQLGPCQIVNVPWSGTLPDMELRNAAWPLCIKDGRWLFQVAYRKTANVYGLLVVGPYKGKWGSGPRSYNLGQYRQAGVCTQPGSSWCKLPTEFVEVAWRIKFASGGKVTVMP